MEQQSAAQRKRKTCSDEGKEAEAARRGRTRQMYTQRGE